MNQLVKSKKIDYKGLYNMKLDSKKIEINLIPNTINPSPDYYCTWQTQLYATNGGKPGEQRRIIGEQGLFSKEKPFGWAYFYEQARNDLFLVMDDSWDVPVQEKKVYFGSLVLSADKFPETIQKAKTNSAALKLLTQNVKSLGWKGLGGWVCAQEAKAFVEGKTEAEYWTQRLQDANESGFSLWKVDWGEKEKDIHFRQFLTDLGHKIAPKLVIEQAMTEKIIPTCDLYRTYDVPAIMSIPMTMEKIKSCLSVGEKQQGYQGLINCEDEAYIAAAGGFVMGIMRHPYVGAFMDERADNAFPEVHRNLKTKIYEVIRAARWHRLAPAFGVNKNSTRISEEMIADTWEFQDEKSEIELWWFDNPLVGNSIKDSVLTKTAVSAIARNTELPEVKKEDKEKELPYIIASKNPNGVYSIATLGRTFGRTYRIPKRNIVIKTGNSNTIGVFGEYENLFIQTEFDKIEKVYAQDIAADYALDITDLVKIENREIVLSGELIHSLGTIVQPKNDTSEPGLVVKIVINKKY